MRFTTTTGSVYELDAVNNRVRRISGLHEPTPYQGVDGEWSEYRDTLSAAPPRIGEPMFFWWDTVGDTMRMTMTSPVMAIGDDAKR